MGLTSCSIINATSDMELNDCPRTNATRVFVHARRRARLD
jgi:hypothetical protein